jgi:hypothetical protein
MSAEVPMNTSVRPSDRDGGRSAGRGPAAVRHVPRSRRRAESWPDSTWPADVQRDDSCADGRVVPIDRYRAVSRLAHPAGTGAALRAAGGGRSQGPAAGADRVPDRVGDRPGPQEPPAPLRLTRRGRVVVRSLVGVVLLLVILLGALVGRPALAGPDVRDAGVAERIVLPGETLWSIAGEVAPDADRRETVEQIVELNGLTSSAVTAGQRLTVPLPAGDG